MIVEGKNSSRFPRFLSRFACEEEVERDELKMWSAVCPANATPAPADSSTSAPRSISPTTAAPASRSKHSATLVGGHVYLLGGRNGNIPLKDFWRYSLADSRWEQLKPTGECPPCLQEHSAVAFKDSIYVFGGELGFSAGTETPLWVYQIKANTWRKIRSQKGVSVPRGRRGHTALVHRGAMLLYGGYQDLRGSCSELWVFDFETESWHLVSGNAGGVGGGGGGGSGGGGQQGGGGSGDRPPARHKHSAILHEECMWVYGGMTDLQERSDFWRWDTHSKTWTNIRSRPNPGPLHGHAACKLPSSMLIFGGERDGQPTNELWRFHFATESWERLQPSGLRPQPRAESVALAVSQLLLHPPRTGPPAGHATPSGESHHHGSSARVRPRGGGSVDRSSSANNSSNAALLSSTRHFHCRVSPCEPCDPGDMTEECGSKMEPYEDDCCEEEEAEGLGEEVADGRLGCDGDEEEDDEDEEEDCRWGGNGRRRSRPRKPNVPMSFSAQHPNVPQSNNLSFLREISKISQINLSRLSRHNHCSYSVLSSDSSESICNVVGGDHVNVQSCAIGCRRDHQEMYSGCGDGGGSCMGTPGKMVKSQSANLITVGGRGKGTVGRGRGRGGRHGSGRRGQDGPDAMPSRLPRDPVSVPNFGAIQKSSIPPLTPVEMTRLVFLDTDEEEDGSNGNEASHNEPEVVNEGSRDALIINSPPPPVTDFSVLHRQFQPTGGKKRSESTHHLSNSTTESSGIGGSEGAETPVSTGGGIPKSASVRFRHQLVELEEASDETVSTSDYASIETMNCVNSSKAHTPSGMVINNFINSGNGHKSGVAEPDGPYGFSNPNYLGPDISSILSGTSTWKGNGNGGKGENGSSSRVQPHLHLHQTYAQLLNSPPDSVLEDSNGRSCSRFFQDDLELQSLAATPSGCSVTAIPPLASQINPPPLLPPPQLRSAAVPQFLSLHSPLDTSGPTRRCISASKGKGNGVTAGSKCRASSASRAECSFSSSGYHPPPPPPQPPPPLDPNVPLYMFVVGGKERGQVTLFRRPISVWRLQLAPDIY